MAFTSLFIVALAMILPFTPFAKALGLVMLPAKYFLILEATVAVYLGLVFFVQRYFIRRFGID
jgi:Mg2+-importing ATPase